MSYSKIPLIIGLIGHRKIDPSDYERIQDQFDMAIESLITRYKYTQVSVLTSLADGADRIAHSSRFRSKIRIIGVMPFDIDEYQKDFQTVRSQDEFELLVKQCDQIIVRSAKDEYSDLTNPVARARAYEETAEWLTQNSEILFAIWDGNFTGKVGGTGETIRKSLTDFSDGKFLHILASNDGSYVTSSCGCGGHDPQIFGTDSSFEKKNLFNKYIVDNSSSIFEVFDSAATRLRKAYDSRVKRSLLLGFILINLITIEEATKDGFWVLIVGLIALLTTTYWFMLKRSRIKEVYEDFRVVAESKRVEMWLQSAGVDGNVFESMGVKELMDPWLMGILEDVRKWEKLSKASTIPGFAVPIKWSEVTNWLDDQIDYLDGTEERQGAIGRNLRQAERYDFVAKISIVSGMSLYFLSKGLNGFFADSGSFVYQGVLGLVFSLALSISAFSLALSQLMGHKEIAARYGASLRVLKNGAIELANASNSGDLAKAQAIVKEIGLESLQETLYWFTVRRTRDVRPL